MAEQIGLAQQLSNRFSAWYGAIESGQRLWVLAAPIVVGLWSISTIVLPVGTPATSTHSTPEISQLLETELAHYVGPMPNALVLWKYSPNLKARTYLGSASTYLSPQIWQDLNGVDLDLEGWDQMIETHLEGKPLVLNKGDFPPNSAIRIAMNKGGIAQHVSVPVRKQRQLLGYLSIGFAEPLEREELKVMIQQLQETAVLARERV